MEMDYGRIWIEIQSESDARIPQYTRLWKLDSGIRINLLPEAGLDLQRTSRAG